MSYTHKHNTPTNHWGNGLANLGCICMHGVRGDRPRTFQYPSAACLSAVLVVLPATRLRGFRSSTGHFPPRQPSANPSHTTRRLSDQGHTSAARRLPPPSTDTSRLRARLDTATGPANSARSSGPLQLCRAPRPTSAALPAAAPAPAIRRHSDHAADALRRSNRIRFPRCECSSKPNSCPV